MMILPTQNGFYEKTLPMPRRRSNVEKHGLEHPSRDRVYYVMWSGEPKTKGT
jgi:hypothetical protein